MLDQYIEHLENVKQYSPHTVKAYRREIGKFLNFLDQCEVDTPTKSLVRRYLSSMSRHLSKRSVGRNLAAIRSYYRYLMVHGEVDTNPMALIQAPKVEKKLPKFLDETEVNRLLQAPDTSTNQGRRDRAILEILYGCGLRVQEVSSLNVGHIQTSLYLVRVFGKGSKERIVPIGVRTLAQIDNYLDHRPQDRKSATPLFFNRFGNRLSVRSIRTIVTKYSRRADLGDDVTPHTLRHSFATHLLNRGLGLREVQELLGHESISTTQIYTHVSRENLKSAYDEFFPRG